MSSINVESVSHAIAEALEKDEQQWDYLSQLTSSQNGLYNYDANRLSKVKEVSVPKAISDSIHHQNLVGASASSSSPSAACFGGFFEAIHRAYFVVDSSLFLWDYANKERWCCLNQFNDEITAVCLVQAKANMFVDKIRFLLIVATKIEIMLIGIGFANNSVDEELEAFPTKYSTSTDNVRVNKIVADHSETQRVFLCCDHGNAYEFEYFYKQNLFGQHCRTCVKSNISDSLTSKLLKSFTFPEQNNGGRDRTQLNGIIDLVIHPDIFNTKCLFSLSASGDIHGYVFYYHSESTTATATAPTEQPPQQQPHQQQHSPLRQQAQVQAEAEASRSSSSKKVMTKMLSYSGKKLWNEIQLQIQQMTDDNQSYFYHRDVRLVKLFAVTRYESQRCQLMGVTRDGDRLFFQISSNNDALSLSWWNMELCFVRIRAPFLNYQQAQQQSFEPCIQASSPSSIHANACFHDNGVTFMNSVKNHSSHSHHACGNDCLLLLWRNDVETQKSKYARPQLIESIECDIVSGRNDNVILGVCQVPRASPVLLFSSKELHKLNAGKPLLGLSQFAVQHVLPAPEYLCLRKHCLVAYRLRRNIDIFRECLQHRNHARIMHFVTSIGLIECEVMCLFILLADNHSHTSSEVAVATTAAASAPASSMIELEHTASSSSASLIRSEALNLFQTEVNQHNDLLYHDLASRLNCPCSKLLSIYLCVSRILRPLWSHTICVVDTRHNRLISARYSLPQLLAIATPLKKLESLLAELTVNVAPLIKEQLVALHAWLDKCLQTLHALMALTHCPFSRVYDELSTEDQILLQHISFEQLLAKESGAALLRNVVHSLTTHNKLGEHHIKQLHTHCPLYFSSAQFVTFLVQSQLNRSGGQHGALENALDMLCEVCGDPSFDLQNVCVLLKKAAYYTGVVKLVFTLQAKLMAQISELYKQKQHQHQLLQVQTLQPQAQQPAHAQHQLQALPHPSVSMNIDAQIVQLKNRVLYAWQQILDCVHRLFVVEEEARSSNINERDLHEKQHRVLTLCVQQENRDFAYKLYEWCLEHNINLLRRLYTFKPKPKYLENFLGENIAVAAAAATTTADGADDQQQQQQQQQQQHERNRRLKELVAYYKHNENTSKMVQLLDALTKSSGFTLLERHNFLIEARRATQALNEQRGAQFDPHNATNDRCNKFKEKANLSKIQLDVLYALKRKCDANAAMRVQERDLVSIEYKLLNLEEIYELCKKYELHECCLDCLAFTNDAKVVDYVNRCWCLYIADCIRTQRSQWTHFLSQHFASLVNRYNLQQQPWMFDANEIVFYLNLTNLQTNAQPSDEVVVDILYPTVKQLSYEQLLTVYKHVLARMESPYKLNIIRSILYLVSNKNPDAQIGHVQPNSASQSFVNPRTHSVSFDHQNTLLMQSSSSTGLLQDLISNCSSYLEKSRPRPQKLIKEFEELSKKYKLNHTF